MKKRKSAARYDALRRECESELLSARFQPADRFYGFRELMRMKAVSQTTLERALRPLIETEKILERRPKSGFYVTPAIELWREKRKSARTKRLGLILPYWASDPQLAMPARIIQGLCAEATLARWRVELIPNTLEESRAPAFADKVLGYGLDTYVWVQPKLMHVPNLVRLQERGGAVVTLGRSFDGFEAPCVRIDAANLAREALAWARQRGAQRVAVVGGPFSDVYFRDIYTALLAEGADLLSRSDIGELFDVPDETARTREFAAARPEVQAWIYLTANNLFHVLPANQPTEPHAAAAGRQFLYLDMGVEAVQGQWPYSFVRRIEIDFEAMGRAALRASQTVLEGAAHLSLPPIPVRITHPN